MADLRNIRTRPGVRINIHPADITDIMTQTDVLGSLSNEELDKISEALTMERNIRSGA